MPDINYDQISLNSVSKASLNGGEWENDFFGNDLAFAHTTEEVNKKAHTTQPEPTDFEIYAQPTESEGEDEGPEGEIDGPLDEEPGD